MAKVNIFLLLPETNPSNQWMQSTETNYDDIDAYERFIGELKTIYELIAIEKYDGFYDAANIKNFFDLYETLQDCYPSAPKRILQSIISKNAFNNWRENIIQSEDNNYQIYSQPLENNTFCEIAERKRIMNDENFALFNHHACSIRHTIIVTINQEFDVEIGNLTDENEIIEWFARNRQPPRNFNINPKHGENRQDVRIINGETVSPLRCSHERAQALLNFAIGNSEKELYSIDPDYDQIIIFKYEGHTPQNMYHGYHVPRNTEEVPIDIKRRLQ